MNMPMRARVATGALVAIAVLGAGWAYASDEGDADSQTTNDAYVEADFSTVAPKVPGMISEVLVEDNQHVKKGELLARIDDRDYAVDVKSAEADLKAAQARVRALRATLSKQSSVIGQAAAAIAADEAAVDLSSANAARYADLASDGSASLQEKQESQARLKADRAAHDRDVAGHAAARAQVPILQGQLASAEAAVAQAQAALDAARLSLSYTDIRSPIDGIVGQRTLRVGNYVQVGSPLLAVVPLNDIYVEAHYRETQLKRIRPGQPATLRFDMLPDVELKGHVDSVAPATGVAFADVAPENATGNFTKITQRLSVRIALDGGQAETERLRVGMSAIPTIDTEQQGS